MGGSTFGWVGVGRESGVRKVLWDKGGGPVLQGNSVWFRGINNGDTGRLLYSLDGKAFVDTGTTFRMIFKHWKGSRISIFSYGPNGGSADFDYVRYRYGATTEALGLN